MDEVFIARGASTHQLNLLADWIRETLAKSRDGELDVIRFVEIDLPQIFPGLYVYIEDDDVMQEKRAFITKDALGIVVSESIYEGAANGCLYSSEIILHEVGHLFLHHKHRVLGLHSANGHYRKRVKDTNLANSAEWQASVLATCLLFPYQELKKCDNPREIGLRFGATSKQAERVFRHLVRLRARECNRDRNAEIRWLRQVIDDLTSICQRDGKPRTAPEQLSFFSQSDSRAVA